MLLKLIFNIKFVLYHGYEKYSLRQYLLLASNNHKKYDNSKKDAHILCIKSIPETSLRYGRFLFLNRITLQSDTN